MRILCVDDDPTARILFVRALPEHLPEDEVVKASSGEEAVARLDEESFDLILTDMMMPGLSGLDLLRHVRKQSLETEVIVLTAQASINTAVEAMRAGALDYVEKPLNVPLVVEKVERARNYLFQQQELIKARTIQRRHMKQMQKERQMLEARLQTFQEAAKSIVNLLGPRGSKVSPADLDQVRDLIAPLAWEEKD